MLDVGAEICPAQISFRKIPSPGMQSSTSELSTRRTGTLRSNEETRSVFDFFGAGNFCWGKKNGTKHMETQKDLEITI